MGLHARARPTQGPTSSSLELVSVDMPGGRFVTCPQCGAPVPWAPESRFRPFCSERCRLIDLGAWASESYRVPVADEAAEAGDSANEEPAS